VISGGSFGVQKPNATNKQIIWTMFRRAKYWTPIWGAVQGSTCRAD
jgi:hypothetical protein